MNSKKVNLLAEQYIQSGLESDFNELYRYCSKFWEKQYSVIAYQLYSNVDEVRALYEDKLLECLSKYENQGSNKFSNFLSMSLKNARADLHNKNKKQYDREVYPMGFSEHSDEIKKGDASSMLDLHIAQNKIGYFDENKIEQQAIGLLEVHRKKTQLEKQHLILLLADKQKAQVKTIIQLAYQQLKSSGSINYTAIGKQVGIHRSNVKRKLEKVRHTYDEKKYGNLENYIGL